MFEKIKDSHSLKWQIKEWFVIFEDRQEGPYSLLDLKKDHRFNPDTLVWKKGYQEWTLARFVPEMKEVFKDASAPKPLHEPKKGKGVESDLAQQNQAILAMQQDPYQFFLWILLLLLILFYTIYQIYSH